MENMSPLELYYQEKEQYYLDKGLDEEEAQFEALGDYYKNYSILNKLIRG
jgi:hypothetical protein